MELAELDELDFASWKRPWADLDDEAPEGDPELGKVLTLRRLLETVADFDRPVELAIETKHPTRYGGLVEKRLVELLATFGWAGAGSPARVMSFSWIALKRIERLAPELDVVFLMHKHGGVAACPAPDPTGLDRRARHRAGPRAPEGGRADRRAQPGALLDRQHGGRRGPLPRPRGRGGDHRPTRANAEISRALSFDSPPNGYLLLRSAGRMCLG